MYSKIVFTFCFFSFAALCQADDSKISNPENEMQRFARVYEQVKQSYVEEISDQQLIDYAIKGMISELDPHSAYLTKSEFEDLQASISGEYAGIGIEIGLKSGFITVVSPIDDSPASAAGIEAGDRIVRVDDIPVKGLNLTQVTRLLRGSKNTKVTITVFRNGIDDTLDFLLVREIIKIKSVRYRTLDDHFLYLRISSFQTNTGADLQKALDNYLNKNPQTKGVILDLRNNPGGDLHSAITVADTFLDGGLITFTQGRMPNSSVNYQADIGDNTFGLPMVTMINDGSASASEIVAGALQDHRRAVILGTRSFGKGSVQSVMQVDNQQAVKLTTALYYTPLGRSIQAQGIMPDIVVEKAYLTPVENNIQSTEADLNNHLNNANNSEESNSASRREKRISTLQLLKDDNQLQEALNLLKGIQVLLTSNRNLTDKNIPASISTVLNDSNEKK